MKILERTIPDLKGSILIPLIGHNSEDKTEAKYLDRISAFERTCEKSLIELLEKIDVMASVKSDPYSLPYTGEVVEYLNGESYLNGAYEFSRVARPILKEVLNKNIYKFRFYMFINVIFPTKVFPGIGRIEYKFRYYPH